MELFVIRHICIFYTLSKHKNLSQRYSKYFFKKINFVFLEKPYSIYEYSKLINKHIIRTISPQLAEMILEEMITVQNYDFSKTQLLNHLDLNLYKLNVDKEYKEQIFTQRMLQLSLCSIIKTLRSEIMTDEFFCLISKSKFLALWMLSCSDSYEQIYLNTCDISATLTSFVAIHPNLASLLFLSDKIISHLNHKLLLSDKKIPAYGTLWFENLVPSQYEYSNKVIENCVFEMNKIKKQIKSLLNEEKNESKNFDQNFYQIYFKRLSSLVKNWHHNMQVLSSIFIPQSPIVLTSKLISNKWLLSSRIMTVFSLISQFIPGAPSILSRANASRELELVPFFLYHTQTAILNPDLDPIFLNLNEILLDLKLDQQFETLHQIWYLILYSGGVLFSSKETLFSSWLIGHLSYCTAQFQNGQMHFLISDPEISSYKLLTVDQMRQYLIDQKSCVNFLDATTWQFYRTKVLNKNVN